MKRFLSTTIVVLAALAALSTKFACAPAKDSPAELRSFGGPIGEYRGVSEIDGAIRTRMLKEGSSFSIRSYLGEFSLGELLGIFKSSGGATLFINSKPNAANLVLYHLALRALARDVSESVCLSSESSSSASLFLNEAFRTTVEVLCAWPAAAARSDGALEQLWLGIMDYDAPHSEFLEWKGFLQSNALDTMTGREAIRDAVFTALYNPHFLLRK